MNPLFDTPLDRSGSHSEKYDGRARVFGDPSVQPLWVADMDFACPAPIIQALQQRLEHPILGYTQHPAELTQALLNWLDRRHGCTVPAEWVSHAPGVVPSLHATALALAQPGDGIIVQPPVYPPFFSAVHNTGRQLLLNPLHEHQGHYRMNLPQLSELAPTAKILFLCSPHNPVGAVWPRQSLLELAHLAKRHNLYLVSDEIHHDLIMPGHTHTPLISLMDQPDLADYLSERLITLVAPSKTFNIPGMGLSSILCASPKTRQQLHKAFSLLHSGNYNPLSISAYIAAYTHNDHWLDQLLSYLADTQTQVLHYLQQHIPQIRAQRAQGTYLLWLDCRALGLTDPNLHRFFIQQALLGLNPGTSFGDGGQGHMRLNLAAPQAQILQALNQLRQAVQHRCAGQ
jgi:cysteine-S-conjugate beta-lyase